MGIYANPALLKWFTDEYTKRVKSKLDMGKSCIRFKKLDDIPFDLIGELMQKITAKDWINLYESAFLKK
jgi:CheY-specific phosphatase CheX